MKTFIFKAIVLAVITISFYGCSSDESKDSDCPILNCQNEGVFENCSCNCPEGYVGTNCEVQLTPIKVLITKITVKSFPNQDAGSNWDFSSLPDIYVSIENSSNILYSSNEFYQDAISNGSNLFQFNINPAFAISNVSQPYYISLWDYDLEDAPASSDDFMAIAAFYPYDPSRGLPDKITVSNIPSQFLLELSLSYQW